PPAPSRLSTPRGATPARREKSGPRTWGGRTRMGEATAPATRVPALGRIASAAAALVLLAAAGCGYADAPPWAGQGGEPAERWAAGGGVVNDPVDVACEVAAWIVDDALGIEAEPVQEPLSELVA